jgi:peptide/nickel transport system substrate-binding protein
MTLNVNRAPGSTGSPLVDARVREAFEDSIDRDTINQVVFGGEYTPDNQTAAPGSTYFDPDFPVPHRDLGHAKQLLQEAGIPHPSFTLFLPNNPEDGQIGEVMQSMSAEAGFDVKLQTMEAITLFSRADRGDFQAILNIWSGRPDPDQNLSVWLACDASLNRGRYCNPALDKLLHDAASTADEDERVKLYRAAAAIYLQDRPYLFLYHYTWFWAATNRLEGFSTYADGLIRPLGMSMKP